jgi:hypothetical protein
LHIHNFADRQHVGRRVRVLRRELDQLISDGEEASRADQPTALNEGSEAEGWRDAEQFWGGE